MTWKDRALQAADTKAAREEDEQRLRDAQARAKQIKAFQFALSTLLEEDITVDDLQVTADGVTFRWTFEHISRKWGIVMQGVCPDCGASTWSGHVDTLERLGQLLQRFYPESDHVKEHLKTPQVQSVTRTTPLRNEN